MRVESWFGWVFNFGFGGILFELPSFERFVLFSFALFLATASIFVLNQYFDREFDRENEVKKELPIASGRITPRMALVFSISLSALCLILVLIAKTRLFLLFLVYLGLLTAYSAPPLHFKTVPIVDFIIAGIGSGLLPFIIGMEMSHQPGNSPYLERRLYCNALLGAAPLTLFHSGCHIIQALGDFEADRKTGLKTFVVRYGKKKGVIVTGFMFLAAALLPLTYSALGLFPTEHLSCVLVIFPFFIPIAINFAKVMRNPSNRSIIDLQKMASKYGLPIMILISLYMLLLRTGLPKI